MGQRRHGTQLLIAAIMTLLTGSLAGATGLVLCLGADGHRAIELEHGRTGCPILASSQGATGLSVQPPSDCFDVPGASPATTSSLDTERMLMPPLASLADRLEPSPGAEPQLPGSTLGSAAPPCPALHLSSTILLV